MNIISIKEQIKKEKEYKINKYFFKIKLNLFICK